MNEQHEEGGHSQHSLCCSALGQYLQAELHLRYSVSTGYTWHHSQLIITIRSRAYTIITALTVELYQ